ncbi:MAG: ribosome maturation factor RimM [Gammaproteobacteria bacterium]
MPEADPRQGRVIIGKLIGVYGVKGWVKVYSYTRPKENIFNYCPWALDGDAGTQRFNHSEGRQQGKGLVVRLDDITDRAAAASLVGAEISISTGQLPALQAGEHYWHDLLDMEVVNLAGHRLGKITGVKETGANDVLVVEGEQRYLIPWVNEVYIKQVDLAAGSMVVDWEAAS